MDSDTNDSTSNNMDDANSNKSVIKTENESDSDYLEEDIPDYVDLEDIESIFNPLINVLTSKCVYFISRK